MTVTDQRPSSIDYGPDPDEPTIIEGRGWRQITPRWSDRWYEDMVGRSQVGDTWFDPTTQKFKSVTSILGRGVVTDWTGPTKANQAKWTWEHRAWLASLADEHRDEALRYLRDSSSISLDEASARGSAVHRALEAIMHGQYVDRDDLAANGALPYLLAIENFVRTEQPRAKLVEVVCFDRDANVAGTCDLVGWIRSLDGLLVLDWKSRTAGHDRRSKEAVQVAAYARMLEHGYYLNEHGMRTRQPVDGCAVVTFAPDGTYAVHPVNRSAADDLYDVALAMAAGNSVSNLYGKAHKASPPDVNALATERAGRIPADAPQRAMLRQRWNEAGLGAPSEGGLTVDDWPLADSLLSAAEQAYLPFPLEHTAPPVYASQDAQSELGARYGALPADLRSQADRAATGLPSILCGAMTVPEVEDWHRVLDVVDDDHRARQQESIALFNYIRAMPDDTATSILASCPDEPRQWTRGDLEQIHTIVAAVTAGDLHASPDGLAPNPNRAKTLAATGKRHAVTDAADRAALFGLAPPRKWADLETSPVFFAAACGH